MQNLEIMVRNGGSIKELGPVARISVKKSVVEFIDKAQEATDAFYAADESADVEKQAATFLRLVNGFSTMNFDPDDGYRVLFNVKLCGDVLLVEPVVALIKRKKGEDD